ncbi:uncharacterized protein LOC128274338 [Anopheles cruzii]|uniref:uncharacterized protein LOC128274338 n=1 Tax=Anopheles cruzii TaxID=68878 RepID=UPI0022EC4EF0|nr:uncharacterized protein LOC128274338 [Anopheles cruzii]
MGRTRPQLLWLLLVLSVAVLVKEVYSEEPSDPGTAAVADDDAKESPTADEYTPQNLLTSGLRLEHELVKEQADAPSTINGSSEGDIVAIHVDAVGAKEQLRPTLRGLSYMAMSFLPRGYTFVEVLSATREVVAGVRYELVTIATDEAGERHYCRMVILEKPWITTVYGGKHRALEYTNCTTNASEDDATVQPVTQINPAFDANVRQSQELTPQRVEDMEKQIIVDKEPVIPSSTYSPTAEQEASTTMISESTSTGAAIVSSTTEEEGLSEAAKASIDELFGFAAPQKKVASVSHQENVGPVREEVVEETIVPKRVSLVREGTVETTETPSSTGTSTIQPLDQLIQSTFDEVFRTHQEIQKALDEVVVNGGGRDVQLKYRPVFDSLLQKVRASIDSYYRTANGGDSNVDTAAFVVRDNNSHTSPSRIPSATPHGVDQTAVSKAQSSSESDEDLQQHQRVQPQVFAQLRIPPQEANVYPAKVDPSMTATFVADDDDEDGNDQHDILTKEQLTQVLNEDHGLQRVKRDSSAPFGGHSGYHHGPYKGERDTMVEEANEGVSANQPPVKGIANDINDPLEANQNADGPDDVPIDVHETIPVNTLKIAVTDGQNGSKVSSDSKSDQEQVTGPNQAPKIEGVAMMFGDSQEEAGEGTLTKEELTKRLNEDDGLKRDKRSYSSSYDQSDGFYGSYNRRDHGWGGNYYGRPHYPRNPYYGYYRGKRSVAEEDKTLVNLDDPTNESAMKAIAMEAIDRLDQMDTDPYQRMLLEVLTARKISQNSDQTRATYVLDVLTANSRCAEEESKNTESCRSLLMPDTTKQCTLEVHVSKTKNDDSKQVKLTKSKCQKQHKSVGALGGQTPVNVTEPEHSERIRLGLVGYENGKHSNFAIRSGTVQLVAGTIYRYMIDLTDSEQVAYSKCNVKIFTPLPSSDHAPEYNFDCHQPTGEHRHKRDVAPKKLNKVRKTGGTQELTPEEYGKEEHQARIRTGLQKMAQLADGSGNDRKLTIISASQQLVAGKSYTYMLTFPDDEEKRVCKLTVWEKPWLKEKAPEEAFKTTFNCPSGTKKTKREICAGCPSSLSTQDLSDTEHQNRINSILSFHGLTRDRDFKVINASQQVVAGMKYVYNVLLNGNTCELASVERVWLAQSQPEQAYMYSSSCATEGKSLRRRSTLGGIRSFDQDELDDTEHVQRVDKIIVSNGGSHGSKVRIVSGTVQTVSGRLFKYAVEFDDDQGKKVCKLSSWERPWLEKENPTDAYQYTVTCPTKLRQKHQRQHERKRRHAKKTGSSNELTAEELKDKSHVERIKAGLVSYNVERSKTYSDFEILAGSTQQMAGSLYKYTFRVKNEPDIVCKISIWERVWLESQDQRKYNVKCTGDDDTEQPDRQQHQPQDTVKRSVRSLKIDDNEHVRRQFEKFKVRHMRQYASSLEHEMRFNIFRNNLFKIEQLNRHERGTGKYGVTKFADMTTAEYRAHTGLIMPKHEHSNHIRNPIARLANDANLPESFDWRDRGAVTNVKDQGSCGSCWAFSAIANIEGLHQIKTNKLESYSEQELIDCDKVDNGCQGGYMDDAFKAIEKIGGLELESDYPYHAKAQKSCQYNKTLSHVRVKGAVDMPKNETFIAQYLIENGPISIGLNANAMQFYRGGISHPWHLLCNHKQIDHGVLLVGYGIKEYPMFNKTLPYWIIKNSWGPKWGEQGYYRIYRGDNSCGVSEMASSAVIE